MGRGGYHEHAERWGRKSSWQSEGGTRAIRVPEVLAEQILEIAHKLDSGETIDFDTKAIQSAVSLLQEATHLKANAGGAIKSKIREAIGLLLQYTL